MIQLVNLHKSFNGQKVLDDINLQVKHDEIMVIIGQSGQGKSVLLKHIIGLMKPDQGQVFIAGQDITAMDERELNMVRMKFGMLFQDAALLDSMTVEENVAFPLVEHSNFGAGEIKDRVEKKLEMVGLVGEGKKYPVELSGGMRKRAGLARALALEPEILLFDEPTTGLDPVMSDTIDDLILNTQQALQVTCVVISHDIAATFRIGHQVAMIHRGKIVVQGTPDEFKRSEHHLVQEFLRRTVQSFASLR